ncbi:MAG TPA: hypothetical protein VGS80_11370 [Ktedonobacterales bacterium]|nr:hypothetical protein [Ktedonobacterales bacterium]
MQAGAGGCEWQAGTQWLPGLGDEEVREAERRWGITFPPDYRLFLQRLHSVDRPNLCAGYVAEGESPQTAQAEGALATAYIKEFRQYMVLEEGPSFYNWLTDTEAIQGRFDWLVEGLQFDVEHNVLWRESWGPKPSTLEAQKERVRALVAAAPKLVPVFAHRYLLAEPCQAGNPVLSVYESDIIVYGYDLRSYFLMEFYERLGLEHAEIEGMVTKEINARFAQYEAIPFWGELLGA